MKTIELVHGKGVALVDDEDYPLLSLAKWYSVRGYARRVVEYRRGVDGKLTRLWRYMHQDVMGLAPEGLEIDHINRNPLDNRRENLRFTTRFVQAQNVTAKGIYWDANRGKYYAQIMRYGVRVCKRFDSLAQAKQWRKHMDRELRHVFIPDPGE